ncbi:D-alanyl-D-alanine carboxypeptidase / D-alanyl-D-alanine-endopeptidase (penicillin-binding protein 4) [Nonomuraea solani]|uniref:D-alanyl-D-alanine carboxypeptidase / D-alanyl-D-alanine-endopeptidase (Penicillin-binding protein 4) n=1 Tax=Nonomuraea solani TaxID=1144553 RepID=A0A1H6D596_9ACTN|nr:D-alanyl-D-alanine carboxypeptidase/D-alanyl-D-alanine-endopeptidase [Nonomuraea solani]SEG80224.1 D-alanyl-D-alanine carboxypeptidase / D-alanyl-D-alanine-endopeptidase (penicillin-binding protein 4) [Nonomuraea solani]
MARHDRWVMLTTLAVLQALTIVTGVYAMTTDFSLGALTSGSSPTKPTASPAEGSSPVPVVTSGPVLAQLSAKSGDGPLPTKGTLTRQLTSALGDKALGSRVGAVVIDTVTGEQLFAANPDLGITPASTTKIVTCAAALSSLGPDARLSTRAVQGAKPGTVVLVGGGDPFLAGPSAKVTYPKQASLATLAARTAATLKAQGVRKVTLSYDSSLFTGATKAPGWKTNYIPDGEVAPTYALTMDEGRQNPPARSPRVANPPQFAAAAFARLLARQGIGVSKSIRPAKAAAGAAELGKVDSAPLFSLVEHTLTASDNDLAEALLRHVAIKEGQPATYEGGAKAVIAVLQRLGVGQNIALSDGSGLSIRNRISPNALAKILAMSGSAGHPDLHAIASGMPIAGFSGTLGNGRRFTGADSKDQVGLVRAKTGTLNNINTLAGMATTKDGRLVTFAFLADRVPANAEPVLDRLAATVARS